ncbi:hypothetical protein NQZ79_g7213 [Umbelopsis isabellina]|nr:hypothetical protein NQZ79_g7213 [Umbelopsis isabellina]
MSFKWCSLHHSLVPDKLEGIKKPSDCPAQLKGYNARQMIANHKAQIYTHFHKFQIIKKIAFFLSKRINRLIFVADSDGDQSLDGAVPGTAEVHGDEEQEAAQEEEEEEEEEENLQLNNMDDDSDSDEDEEEVEDMRPIAGGERLARLYIPEMVLSAMIQEHRQNLGNLLFVPASRDNRKTRLTRQLLKEKEAVAPINRYFKFLRSVGQTLDCRRFQLFPEYKMVTKHFHIDEIVLGHLCRKQIAKQYGVTAKAIEPSKQRNSFHRNIPEHISISTDGYGCRVTVGGGPRLPAEPIDEEDSAGEGSSGPTSRTSRKRKRKPSRKRPKNEIKDISNTSKGRFRLEKVTPESLSQIMVAADLIGVDPGMKSLMTAVRSDNPHDKVEPTSGYWKNARLTRAFESKEQDLRKRAHVNDSLVRLSTIRRDDFDGWVDYVKQYYTDFAVLHPWYRLAFYRRWCRSREIRIQSTMAGMNNPILSSHSRLPPIKPVAATGPDTLKPSYQDQHVAKVVAWGGGNFGNRKGS